MGLKIIEVVVDSFSKRGHGVAPFERQDGMLCSVEVPFTIPGDRAQAQLLSKKSGLYKSILTEIIEASPKRIEPRCKHFGVCGGCKWQQISYEDQLKNKQEFVVRTFGELICENVNVFPIIPCEEPWHYRNKMEFTFSTDKAGTRYLGLMMDSGKGRVFHLEECHLSNSWFVEALKAAREWWMESKIDAYHPWKNTGSLQTLTVREGLRTGDRLVNLTVSGNPDYALKRDELDRFVAFMRAAIEPDNREEKLSIFLTIKQMIKGQPTRLFEMHLYGADHIREILHVRARLDEPPEALTFKVSSLAFFQPNTGQAEKLYTAMLLLADIPKNAIIYDLYCGTGTLGICAAKHAKQVIGIELSREASLDGRQNAEANGMAHVTILTGSVEEKLAEIQKDKLYPLPDVVVVDPPRVGLEPKALKHLLELSPPMIVYVSCNPVTQSANIRELTLAGYRLSALQPVDQFPHTVHIENIAILKK